MRFYEPWWYYGTVTILCSRLLLSLSTPPIETTHKIEMCRPCLSSTMPDRFHVKWVTSEKIINWTTLGAPGAYQESVCCIYQSAFMWSLFFFKSCHLRCPHTHVFNLTQAYLHARRSCSPRDVPINYFLAWSVTYWPFVIVPYACKSILHSLLLRLWWLIYSIWLPYKIKTQYAQILNIIDTFIKHLPISSQSTPVVKSCIGFDMVDTTFSNWRALIIY